MYRRHRRPASGLALLLCVLWLALPAWAEDKPAAETPAKPPSLPPVSLLPADAASHHKLGLSGQEIAYTATAGTLPLRNEKGEKQAEMFYVAFLRDGVADPAQRPITYAFNGGPGAASAYLNIGAIGPRMLDFGPSGAPQAAGERVVDNPDTWLAFTDLVFLDPVGTGYSRAGGGAEDAAKKFWSVRSDLDALAQAIRLHLTRAGRLTSPIYLVGESYGGFRAARLAQQLASQEGIAAAGVMLVSPVLEFRLMSGDEFDVLPWALRLPSYAAVNLETKGALSPEALADAEHFALSDYLVALAGETSAAQSEAFYARIASLIGLDEPTVAHWRGRVPIGAYVKEMRRGDGQVLSRYDGSVAAADPFPRSREAEDDPILQGTIAPFTRAFTAYVRSELGFATDLDYELLNGDVGKHWEWRDGDSGGRHVIGASDALRRALALHPRMHVLIAHGLTDLTTPYMMSRYVVAHLPSAITGSRVELKLYPGGHMMYLRSGSRHRLHDDAAAFYEAEGAR